MSRQPVSARRMNVGEAVIAAGRGSEGLMPGMCWAPRLELLLTLSPSASKYDAQSTIWSEMTSGASESGGARSAFPHCSLQTDTSNRFGPWKPWLLLPYLLHVGGCEGRQHLQAGLFLSFSGPCAVLAIKRPGASAERLYFFFLQFLVQTFSFICKVAISHSSVPSHCLMYNHILQWMNLSTQLLCYE